MKPYFLLLNFFLPLFFYQSSVYKIQVETIDGTKVNLSSYQGKKIIITEFNAANPEISWLKKLDSLQSSDTSLRVIVVPANDLGGTGNDTKLASLLNSLSLKILMLKSAFVKKSSGINQHPLFKWLTNVNENTHFDVDVESAKQLFIVSKTGTLYGVLTNNTPGNVLPGVLNKSIDQ